MWPSRRFKWFSHTRGFFTAWLIKKMMKKIRMSGLSGSVKVDFGSLWTLNINIVVWYKYIYKLTIVCQFPDRVETVSNIGIKYWYLIQNKCLYYEEDIEGCCLFATMTILINESFNSIYKLNKVRNILLMGSEFGVSVMGHYFLLLFGVEEEAKGKTFFVVDIFIKL